MLNFLVWLLVAAAAALAGYAIYRLAWWVLTLIRARDAGPGCVACGRRGPDLYTCDICRRRVCRQHVVTYSRGRQQQLLKPQEESIEQYVRELSLPPGHWCPACDLKRLAAVMLGVVGGDVVFVAILAVLLGP